MAEQQKTNNSMKQFIIAIVVVVVGALGIAYVADTSEESPSSVVVESEESSNQLSEDRQALQTMDSISYQGVTGSTALELLKQNAEVETEDSSFGEYVTAINGEDGDGSRYWIFYVNGEAASVGAGDYQTTDGENIEWNLE